VPFKSQAQRRKFAQLLVEGKISPQTFEEWNRETGGARLPEHVGDARKRGTKPKAAARKTAARKAGARKRAARRRR
jgi:hypothetical protein